VTEQGTYRNSEQDAAQKKQLINHVKTELWYKQQVHQKMKYKIKIKQQLSI
jgi:hypothetical protein